jgi:hypothetical protein
MGKVYYLDEMEDFVGADDWKLEINISDIWKQYTNKEITVEDFNQKYYNRLVEYKNNIVSLGTDVWNNLVALLPKLNEVKDEELISLYDDIYDWADENDVHIKTK